MPVLNRIRITCRIGDRDAIQVKSNLDSTHKLGHRTDEDICFTDADVVAIQNKRESRCLIVLTALRLPDGRRAVLRPSRQAHQTLTDPEVSRIRSSTTLVLGGGETCMLTSSEFKGGVGAGAVVAV
jgi:hypothetical protein